MAARSAISKPTRGVTRRDGGLGSRKDWIPGANGTKGKGETQVSPPTNRGRQVKIAGRMPCSVAIVFLVNHQGFTPHTVVRWPTEEGLISYKEPRSLQESPCVGKKSC